ncbi:MAG: protoporphyrinogen oxidase [Acidobacteria bacterium]|nr:protoporphyrinogen oxidase [Acidobacteriota bacterium]
MTSGIPNPELDVLVVGGGIAGLAAAYQLQRLGRRVRVLEASGRLGGVIRTERFDGWTIDGGPDALLVQKPAAVALCRELGIADRLIPTLEPRTAYVMRDRRLHPIAPGSFLGFPLSAAALARSSLFTWAGRLRMACEVAIPRGGPGGEDESIASFVRRRFGSEAADYLAEPLLAGIHAGDAERLSMRALFPRLLEAERRSGSVIRSMRALRLRPSPQGAFVSLPGGVGELVEALAAALEPGSAVCSARVTGLRRGGAAYAVESDAGRFDARAVMLAIPAYAAARLLRSLDTALAALCDGIPYASTATVAFGYRRDQIGHPMRGSGFVVPRLEDSPLLAATWVSSKWPGRAPEGCALLRAFLGGGRDPRGLDRTDDDLTASARESLEEVLDITGPPLVTRLFRWPLQSPQYDVGHLERVAAIDERLTATPGLFLTGSGFRAIGIPDCIADGRATAAGADAYLAAAARQAPSPWA